MEQLRNARAEKRETPEKTRRPVVSSGTIPTCENPGVTRSRIEPCTPPWSEASSLTTQPPRSLIEKNIQRCSALSHQWRREESPPPSIHPLFNLLCHSVTADWCCMLFAVATARGKLKALIRRLTMGDQIVQPANRILHCLMLAITDFHSAVHLSRCSYSIARNSATHSLTNSSALRAVTLIPRLPWPPGRINAPRVTLRRRLARFVKRCFPVTHQPQYDVYSTNIGAAVAQWLAHSPPTTAIRVRSSVGSLPDFRMLESCWTMPLAGGFSRSTPVSPALAFQRRSVIGSHFMSCPGMTGTYGSQLESPSLGAEATTYNIVVPSEDAQKTVEDYSPPTQANRVRSRIFTSGNRAERSSPSSLHSRASPYSPHFTLIGSQDLDAPSTVLTQTYTTNIPKGIAVRLTVMELKFLVAVHYLCTQQEPVTTVQPRDHSQASSKGHITHVLTSCDVTCRATFYWWKCELASNSTQLTPAYRLFMVKQKTECWKHTRVSRDEKLVERERCFKLFLALIMRGSAGPTRVVLAQHSGEENDALGSLPSDSPVEPGRRHVYVDVGVTGITTGGSKFSEGDAPCSSLVAGAPCHDVDDEQSSCVTSTCMSRAYREILLDVPDHSQHALCKDTRLSTYIDNDINTDLPRV
ncbi:hypothetical protein PR048_015324 [Dryococelus australis]|uniref:Uncharacterized protein n=1 Tax=Dryococelus australis TaxID=614101 RepID=A0ABQ9HGW8_9NEOP|nr:hypothetical protein PR048_015324 [Dryococelus australis]